MPGRLERWAFLHCRGDGCRRWLDLHDLAGAWSGALASAQPQGTEHISQTNGDTHQAKTESPGDSGLLGLEPARDGLP